MQLRRIQPLRHSNLIQTRNYSSFPSFNNSSNIFKHKYKHKYSYHHNNTTTTAPTTLPSHHSTQTRFLSSDQVSKVSSKLDETFHPKIQTLLFGFLGGIVFTSLYNKEWPGYERRLISKSRKGDSEAQVRLGELYLYDPKYSKKPRSKKRAFEWFCNSADQGNQRAHYYLGLLHKNRDLEASNDKAAYYHFNIAALSPKQSDTINLNGEKNSDRRLVTKWLDENTRSNAKYELGLCYLSGTGCDRDVKEGMRILEEIGRDGNSDAAGMLSGIYLNGKYGVSVNSSKGLSWKREAGRLGNKECSKEMNELYISKGKDIIDASIVGIDQFSYDKDGSDSESKNESE